jgi:hypothetical protein
MAPENLHRLQQHVCTPLVHPSTIPAAWPHSLGAGERQKLLYKILRCRHIPYLTAHRSTAKVSDQIACIAHPLTKISQRYSLTMW